MLLSSICSELVHWQTSGPVTVVAVCTAMMRSYIFVEMPFRQNYKMKLLAAEYSCVIL